MSIIKAGERAPEELEKLSGWSEEPLGIPGSRRSALFYQDLTRLPTVSHGEGIYIYDEDGRCYLDGCSGAVSANLGHRHPRMVDAVVRQMNRIAFAYRLQFENRPANDLADLLVRLSPPELDRVFFVNSGSEAVEAAMKLARQFWWASGNRGKSLFIARRPSYHGATLGALSATDYAPLKIPFAPMSIRSPKVSAPFCYHCPLSLAYPQCGIACAWELERKILVYGPENVAAFIAEPIGGSTTGAAVPPDEYFPIIERICHRHEVILIIDDVMTGCGRTGTFYGYAHWPIVPDIVATSKGLSAGYTPMGAIVASSRLVEPVLRSGGFMHGHTYAGNPLSAAICREAVNTVLDEGLVENAREVGTFLHERLWALKDRYPFIGDVRGRGLLAAIEFVRDRERRMPFPANWLVALEATEVARRHGLLLYPRRSLFGLGGDHVLVAPPLVIRRDGVEALVERLERALEELGQHLEDHLEAAPPAEEDRTHQRFEQVEDVPDWAVGQIRNIKPATDANVTAAMAVGRTTPDAVQEDVDR